MHIDATLGPKGIFIPLPFPVQRSVSLQQDVYLCEEASHKEKGEKKRFDFRKYQISVGLLSDTYHI